MKQLILFVGITGLFTACSPKIAPDQYWSEKRWVLTELKGVPVQLSGGRKDAFLEFRWTEKRFSGNGGCNSINGTYTLERKEIHFGEVMSTKMSCPDIAFETTFLETLRNVDRYEMENDRLILRDGRKQIMVFQAR